MRFRLPLTSFAAIALLLAASEGLRACPFCDAPSQTLSEEIRAADGVVLAKLLKEAPPQEGNARSAADPNAGMATFQIVEVLRGKEKLKDAKEIRVVFFGESDHDRVFLISGIGADKIDWTTPLPLSAAAIDYVRKLPDVPTAGHERLVFFQEYLEHEDPLLAQDAYDEFARAPYQDLHGLKDQMKHDQLMKWVATPEVSPSRRRLYLTMLGVCGTKDDLPLLESMISSDFETMQPELIQFVRNGLVVGGPIFLPTWIEVVGQDERRKKLGLDALIACYLILRGPDGLDLVDNRFLKNPKAEYTYIYSTIMALRFHGDQDTGVLPRERLLKSMRLLLDNPDFADQVVLDLSRWEDWSVLDRLVTMFKKSDEKGYIRQPVVSYLTVAAEQAGDVGTHGKAALEELEKLDPETVKQARSLMAFGALGRARGVASGSTATTAETNAPKTDASESQAFAASEADDQTKSTDIPEPASFDKNENKDAATAKSSADDKPPSTKGTEVTASKVTVAPADITVPDRVHVNPLLVAGVPLVAAALLMGVYWLILRAGAV